MKKLLLIFAFCLIGLRLSAQTPVFSFPLNESGAKWGNVLTSGSLVVDETYRIVSFEAGDDFSNLGAVNETGDEFTASGTTPDVWSNLSELRQKMAGVWETQQGKVGVPTDVYNVQDHRGSGRRWYETTVDNYFTLSSIIGVTTDLSIFMKVKSNLISGTQYLVNDRTTNNDFQLRILGDGTISFTLWQSDGTEKDIISTEVLVADIEYKIEVFANGADLRIYINESLDASTPVTYDGTIRNTSTLTKIGNTGGASLNGIFYFVRIFNDDQTSEVDYYSVASNPIKDGAGNVLELNAEGVRTNQWADLLNGEIALNNGATMQIPSTSNLGAMWFNGSTSKVVFDAADIEANIFDGGATIACWINPLSSGADGFGRITDKMEFLLYLRNQSGSNIKLAFNYGFSGGSASWTTTSAVVPINEVSFITLSYDNSSTVNNPILTIITAAGITTIYTVGDGLDESPPSGTRNSDSEDDLYLGNNSGETSAFEGKIKGIKFWKKILSRDEIQEKYGQYKN